MVFGVRIVHTKIIYGHRGSPDLFLGDWAFPIGGAFIIYGVYALISSLISIVREKE